ncbi:MAG: sugar ABC transporter ATP-binding protein [Planctomycetota bacterium]|jgi:ABC-type sugar transport system ATPase subunit|nr:sugar ABC transporter ATP-binding protein [Planctomycetota bacterium]
MSTLECQGLTKSFGAVQALQNVSFSIAAGEVRAIFGGNGSGKSTLAKILGGSVFADQGRIICAGQPVNVTSPVAAKNLGIIVTSQELSLLGNLTVEENLQLCDLPRRVLFTDRQRIHQEAMLVLERFHLEKFARSPVASLAPNQQYLLEFAKALIQKPKILVIDEITSALYREDVAQVKAVINELKAGGCCQLFISHRLNELYDICESITILRNGELVETAPLAGISEDHLLSQVSGQDVTKVILRSRQTTRLDNSDKTFLKVRDLALPGFTDSVSLDIAQGEIIGVAGLQGNGQSGLVRSLFALEGPIGMECDGASLKLSNPSQAVHHGFAFVSGDREREGTFSIRSLLENTGAVTDLVLGKKNRHKEESLRQYRVAMRSARQPIRTLSGGNQQKVVLARWTTTDPRLFLADDPTKGIDVTARREVHSFMHELARRGTSVVFVSSDSEELVDLTRTYSNSRVIIMYKGQIIQTLKGAAISAENIAYHEVPKGGSLT